MVKNKFQLRRERTLEGLLRSAAAVFSEKGYAAATIDDIVEGTAYTRGAFYFHFESKRECFLQVIARRQALRTGWNEVPYELDPEVTSVEEMVRVALVRLTEREEGAPPLVLAMVDFFQAHRSESDIAEILAPIYRNWTWEIVRFVDGIRERRWIRTTRPSREIAEQVFAVIEGLNVHRVLYGLEIEAIVVPTIVATIAS